VERVLGLPASEVAPEPVEERGDRLPATERGTLVHALLERLDFRRPRVPDAEAVLVAARAAIATVPSRGEAERIATMIGTFARGELVARLAQADSVRREERFAFPLGGASDVLVTGAIDVLARERGGGALVVDYKSDALGGRSPAALMHAGYETQRLIYALAALRDGARTVEVVHVFLERPEEPLAVSFTADDAPGLQERLRALAAGPLSGAFPVAERPVRTLCQGCPAQDGLCSWPLSMTTREHVDTLF
jgi:ATP-dependent exoDNAse (exonuclease V) beta subunit